MRHDDEAQNATGNQVRFRGANRDEMADGAGVVLGQVP